ncbi:hypothetical protein PMAYCL1PPCAC_26036, partial [Pristionchus mayeri]
LQEMRKCSLSFWDQCGGSTTPVSAPIGNSLLLIMIAMLAELVIEVRKGNPFQAKFNFRYQRLAVRSLIIQGALPSLMYAIPAAGIVFLQLTPSIYDVGDSFNRF